MQLFLLNYFIVQMYSVKSQDHSNKFKNVLSQQGN